MKRILWFLAALAAAVSCASAARSISRADKIAAEIHNPSSKYVVVACHRGDWRNWPENSIPAIESVIQMGADIVEIDIKMTADSVLVLSHDGDVKRCTNFSRVFRSQPDKSPKIKDLTLAEIKSLSLKRSQGVTVDTLRMPTLREALECTKDRICVNVDQGYEFYDQVLAITEELGVTDQVLIKGSKPLEMVEAKLAQHPHNMMYMPIVNAEPGNKGFDLLNSYMERGVVPLAYEVCWGTNEGKCFPAAAKRVLDQGSKLWVNTLWGSLCGGDGNDDDAAFQAADPGQVYQQYLDAGASMIQTDRPELLIGWLKKQGRHTL
ncbi:MAG: glycerophosphodiester phosphodiesterase family protein [Bacteroidales bacterium]|nr:glycerophosphodiester phosphodiesterase family protein [Bacteroidales bacterium]